MDARADCCNGWLSLFWTLFGSLFWEFLMLLFWSLFAGIYGIIPFFGPIISAVPGVLLGFLISPWKGLIALVLYVVSQQIESQVIVPQVMKRAVGLNPIVIILSLLIGLKLGGVLGAIFSHTDCYRH